MSHSWYRELRPGLHDLRLPSMLTFQQTHPVTMARHCRKCTFREETIAQHCRYQLLVQFIVLELFFTSLYISFYCVTYLSLGLHPAILHICSLLSNLSILTFSNFSPALLTRLH